MIGSRHARMRTGGTFSRMRSDACQRYAPWLVLTVVSIAAAEVARPVRYLNMLLGAALVGAPLMFAAGMAATIVSVARSWR